MRSVASAMAYLHKQGLTHNDIKPENVLLKQANLQDPQADVIVKLADFGLAAQSRERNQDFVQFGMTTLCMTTGEKFGTRKFQLPLVDSLVKEMEELVANGSSSHGRGRIGRILRELPTWLRKIW